MQHGTGSSVGAGSSTDGTGSSIGGVDTVLWTRPRDHSPECGTALTRRSRMGLGPLIRPMGPEMVRATLFRRGAVSMSVPLGSLPGVSDSSRVSTLGDACLPVSSESSAGTAGREGSVEWFPNRERRRAHCFTKWSRPNLNVQHQSRPSLNVQHRFRPNLNVQHRSRRTFEHVPGGRVLELRRAVDRRGRP